jgi:ABC-type sulfate transport system permease component
MSYSDFTITTVCGAVTTGILWRFLRLDGKRAGVDIVEYPIQTPRKVFGILTAIVLGEAGV